MKSVIVSVALALVACLVIGATPVFAKTLEQQVFYQFNPKRVDPQKVSDKRLKEVIYKGQVLWVAPPSKPSKPTFMYFHGSAGNLAQRAKMFPWFLKRGYGLVAVAYPGSSGSAGEPTRQKIQSLATQIYRDMPKFVGDSPIVLMGQSLGTGVAVELAAKFAGQANAPHAVVLISPYTSLLDLVLFQRPLMYPLVAARTDLWPSKNLMKMFKTPLFIMHGQKDDVVPYAQGKKLYDLSASPNKELATISDADHNSIWQDATARKLSKWIRSLPKN